MSLSRVRQHIRRGFLVRGHARKKPWIRGHRQLNLAWKRQGMIRVYPGAVDPLGAYMGRPDIAEVQFYRLPSEGRGVYEISDIYVSDRYEGTGIGRELVRLAEESIRNDGGKIVYLMSVVPEAEGFWRKMGYDRKEMPDRYQWMKKL